MQYAIWYQTSGGITGYHAKWLSTRGRPDLFDTFEDAAAVAANIQRMQMESGHRNRLRDFSYTACAFDPERD